MAGDGNRLLDARRGDEFVGSHNVGGSTHRAGSAGNSKGGGGEETGLTAAVVNVSSRRISSLEYE